MDVPGFGITGPATDKSVYGRQGYVEFPDAFAAGLDIRRFCLVGSSLGGYIAWNYTLEHPGKVDRLILVDPVGGDTRHQGALPW